MLLYTELTAKADLSLFPFFITTLKDGAILLLRKQSRTRRVTENGFEI